MHVQVSGLQVALANGSLAAFSSVATPPYLWHALQVSETINSDRMSWFMLTGKITSGVASDCVFPRTFKQQQNV